MSDLHHELTTAASALEKATTVFDSTQIKTNEDLVSVVEKVALYAAGIISLSVTFAGSILDRVSRPLDHCFFHHPLKYSLFLAWFLLLVSFISGLFVRWFNAKTIFWVHAADWLKKRGLYSQTRVKYIESGSPVTISDGTSSGEFISKQKEAAEKDRNACDEFNNNKKRDFLLKIILERVCFIAFGAGVFLLTTVVMVAIANA